MAYSLSSFGVTYGASWAVADSRSWCNPTKSGTGVGGTLAFTSGSGDNQLLYLLEGELSIVASGTGTIDLIGTLKDFFGNTVSITEVKALIIRLKASTAGSKSIRVGGGTTTFESWISPAGASLTLKCTTTIDGVLELVNPDTAGYAAVAGVSDILEIGNNSGSLTATVGFLIAGS